MSVSFAQQKKAWFPGYVNVCTCIYNIYIYIYAHADSCCICAMLGVVLEGWHYRTQATYGGRLLNGREHLWCVKNMN